MPWQDFKALNHWSFTFENVKNLIFVFFVWIPKEFSYSIVAWPAANVNKTSGIQGLGNFTKAMSACRRAGRPSELLALMEEMPKMTVMPNEIRYLM